MNLKLLRGAGLGVLLTAVSWSAYSAASDSEPYLETFEGCSYSQKVPAGWTYQDDYRSGYVNFVLNVLNTGGVNNSKVLQFGTQLLEDDDWDWDYYSNGPEARAPQTDLSKYRRAIIVTPPVAGQVSFYVRQSKSSLANEEFVNVFDVSKSGTKYVAETTSPVEYTEVEEVIDDVTWTKVMLNAGETPRQLALHISNKYFDNFQADYMEIPVVKTMNISGMAMQEGVSTTLYCDEDGKVNIPVRFNLKNTGNITLTPGMENYSVDFVKSGGDVIYTYNVEESLAPNETKEILCTIPYTKADALADDKSFTVKPVENITNTQTYAVTVNLIGYYPLCDICETTSTSGVSKIDLGLAAGSKTVNYRFINKGSAPLTISGLFADNMQCDLDFPVTIAGGELLPFALTFGGVEGVVDGVIAIASNGTGSDNRTQIPYSGAFAAEGTYICDFENGIPANWIMLKPNAWKLNTSSNLNSIQSATSDSDADKLITSKLHFEEGGKFNFAFAGTTFYSSPYPYVKVYYSTDRMNWTEAAALQGESAGYGATEAGDYAYPANTYKYHSVTMPAGDYYMAFEAIKTYVDNVFGGTPAETGIDLFMSDYSAPEKGMINYPVSVSFKLQNLGNATVTADQYSVVLMGGDEKLADITAVDLEAGVAAVDFACTYIPHETCTELPLKVIVTWGEGDDASQLVSPEVKLTVVPEVLVSDHQVGDVTAASYSAAVPYYGYYKNSISLSTYPGSLIGLSAGEKISKISYFMEYTGKDLTRGMRLWLANGNEMTSYADTTNMTSVYVGNVDLTKSTSFDYAGKYILLTFELNEPFEYDGNGLQVMFKSECDTYASTNFASTKQGNTIYSYSDNIATYIDSSPRTIEEVPSMMLALVKKPMTLTGKVSTALEEDEDGQTVSVGLANALVELTGDGLLYKTVTDQEGNYALEVMQSGHEFAAAAYANGHKDIILEAASYDAENPVLDFTLSENMIDFASFNVVKSGTSVSLSWDHVVPGRLDAEPVYVITLNGDNVGETSENYFDIEDVTASAVSRAATHEIGVHVRHGEYLTRPVLQSIITTAVEGVADNAISISTRQGAVVIEAVNAHATIATLSGAVIADCEVNGEKSISLSAGVYVVVVTDGNSKTTAKVVLK